MSPEVKEYVKTCDICQRTKTPRHKPYGEIQSLPKPSKPWSDITMDFITGLPPSSTGIGTAFDSILTMVRHNNGLYYDITTKQYRPWDGFGQHSNHSTT